jgi:hypothetical protein
VLLLVLILVLIAFGLLVVALLSGSVLWAWVSVGVSVAAAAVLLVDWLQRRSAVKAGTEAGDVVAVPPAEPVPPPHAFDGEPAVEPATEVFPAVRSDDRYGDPASNADVEGRGVEGRGVESRGAESRGGAGRDERPDARETVVLDALPPSGSAGQPSGAHDGIGPAGPKSSHSVTSGGIGALAEHPNSRPGTAREAAAPEGDPDAEETVRVTGAGRTPAHRDEAPVGGVPARGAAAGGPPPRGELPPLGPDGAPPEEPRDAEAAGLVAELDDEVLVVDELPRYHLGGCRSLGGSPVIALPAREAVELGFTPCSWCTPDRTLSARHRAPVR